MQSEWLSFLDAIHRITRRLLMTDFEAKPLLRDLVHRGIVEGRGQHREKGDLVVVFPGDIASHETDPDLVREGSFFYRLEVYPGEILASELRSWMDDAEADATPRLYLSRPKPASAEPAANEPVEVEWRPGALVRQDISALLEERKQIWESSGRLPSLRITLEGFKKLATSEIAGAKPTWAEKIWLRDRPIEWAKRGPIAG